MKRMKLYGKPVTVIYKSMKTKPSILGGFLYSVDGKIWFSTPATAQISYNKREK